MVIGIIIIELLVILWLRKAGVTLFVRLFRCWGGSLQASVWCYAVITLPGVLVHEISHFIVAAFTGLRTGTIQLLPQLNPDGGVELGSVQISNEDPFRLSLVGIAPLLAGLAVIAALVNVTPLTVPVLSRLTVVEAGLYFLSPFQWIRLYLVAVIALHLFPSSKDMGSWPIAGLTGALVFGLIRWLGLRLPSTAPVTAVFTGFLNNLTVALGLAVAVVAGATAILLIGTTISTLFGRQLSVSTKHHAGVQWEH